MSHVLVTRDNGVATLRLNRLDALNALTNAMLEELGAALLTADLDPSVRSVVLAANGEKAFCSGIDLGERSALNAEQKGEQSRRVVDLVMGLRRSPKPVFAAIGGWCLGAGLELALAADVRIAAEDARFGFPEMTLGAYPGGGGAVLLPRLIGRTAALEWLLSARRVSADEAFRMGLVSRVASRAELESVVARAAASVAGLAPLAVAALKKSIDVGMDLPLEEAFEVDQSLRRPLDATNDYQEGLRAFKERRAPVFSGT